MAAESAAFAPKWSQAAGKRRALEQRFAEANRRRLAHIHLLMQQARVASERSAQAQHLREARRTTWADESSMCSTTDNATTDRRSETSTDRDREGGGGGKRGGGKHAKHGKGKHGRSRYELQANVLGSDGCSGDERSEGSGRRAFGILSGVQSDVGEVRADTA